MVDYLELTCRLEPGLEERLAEVLSEAPVLGAQMAAGDGGLTSVAVYLDGSSRADADRLGESLARAGARDVVLRGLEARDWLAGWRESARPFAVGRRWWVDPHPDACATAPDGRVRLAVEPRSAFGSGTHETTRLVLVALERLAVAGRSALDVGTGSGILAIAAESLGASPVVAFDIDLEAVRVARRTMAEQGRAVDVLLFAGPLGALATHPFDLVLCNMLTEEMRPLLIEIGRRLSRRGHAILSGALASEGERLRADLAAAELAIEREHRLGEWLAVTVTHDHGR